MSKKVIRCECGHEVSACGIASHRSGNTHKTRMKRMEWLEKHPGWRLIDNPYLVNSFKNLPIEVDFEWEIVPKALWIPGWWRPGYFRDMLGVEGGVRKRDLLSAIKRARKRRLAENKEVAKIVCRELRKLGIPAKLIRSRKRLWTFTPHLIKSPEGTFQSAVNVVWRRRGCGIGCWEDGLFVKDDRSWFYTPSLRRLEDLKPMSLEAFDKWRRQGEWYFTQGKPNGWKFVVEGEVEQDLKCPVALGGSNHLVISAKKVVEVSKDRRGLTLQRKWSPEDPLPPLGFGRIPVREWVQYIITGPALIRHTKGDHDDLKLGKGRWFVFRATTSD